jgi:hypothetical protein
MRKNDANPDIFMVYFVKYTPGKAAQKFSRAMQVCRKEDNNRSLRIDTSTHSLLYDHPLPSQGEFEVIYTIMWMMPLSYSATFGASTSKVDACRLDIVTTSYVSAGQVYERW